MKTSAPAFSPALPIASSTTSTRLAIRFQVGREAAFVADAGRLAACLQDAAQRVKDLGAHPQRLGERRRAERHHHEFLEVDARVGVRAAVEDVHHRHRQREALGAVERADVPVERHALGRPPPRASAAIETPSSALAPSRLLVGVPSSAIIASSSAALVELAGRRRRSAISPLTLATALRTPLPPYRALSPSRSSSASRSPVDAPDGTAARPNAPPSSVDVDFDRRVAARIENFPAVHVE